MYSYRIHSIIVPEKDHNYRVDFSMFKIYIFLINMANGQPFKIHLHGICNRINPKNISLLIELW